MRDMITILDDYLKMRKNDKIIPLTKKQMFILTVIETSIHFTKVVNK